MRILPVLAISLVVAGCGSSAPESVTQGPRVNASLKATWPTAAPARQAAFSRDGKLAAFSDASGAITIRDVHSWRVLDRLRHDGGATTIAFGRDGSRLYSGGYDGNVREWDMRRHRVSRIFKGHGAAIWTLDISPDGRRLVAGGEDAVIRIWNLADASTPRELRGHGRNVWEVRFSPGGSRLASASFDNSVRLWDANEGRALKTLNGHKQAVVGLDFSPDGQLLVSGGDDSTIRYWRASNGALLRTIDNGHHVDKIAFSPDGEWIASGGHPHGLVGELWHELTGGGGEGNAVRIWRAKDGAPVAGLPHPEDVYWVAFSRDGQWLVTSGEDNRFRLWRLQKVAG